MGGSVVTQVPSGSKATKPDINFGGYAIENWYEDASYTTPWDFSTGVITESKTLYGKWEGKYAVVFNHNGKGTNTVQAVMGGQSATQPTNPTYNGYEFMTWQYYTEDAHGTQGLAEYDFSNTVNGPLTLYAKWGVKLIYNPNVKGEACNPPEDTIEEGKLLLYSPVCEPLDSDSYAFGGWFKEAACNNEFNAEQPINGPGPITIYAGWNNVVKFDLNGHGDFINNAAVKTGSKVTKPDDPSDTGYVFKGWYKDNTTFQNPFDFNTAITAPMTLYAKWVEALTVKFYSTNLADVLSTVSIESGDKVTESTIPSISIASGYAFKGWYKESTFVNKWDIDDPVTADLNLYPKVVKLPAKFDTISIEGKDYRVLKEEGINKYLVLGQYNASDGQVYETNYSNAAHKVSFGGITGIKYEGSELDTFLNTTWYGGLSDTLKDAIQSVTITQNIYKCNSGMIPTNDNYIARGSHLNNVYCITGGYSSVSIANRKVYALDVDDLVDYLGKDNFTKNNIQSMVGLIANKYPWLRTASTKSTPSNAWYIDCGTGGPYHILNVAGANIVRPAFVISLAGDIDYTLTEAEKYTLTTSVDETMGKINTETGIYPKNFEVRLVAKPNTGYRFVKWLKNDEDDTSADKNNATRLITITEDIKYTPVFEAAYTITTTVNDETMGSVLPATAGYLNGESVTLIASANAGYRFVKWQIDDVDDTSADKNNPTRTITVSGNAKYTAVFEAFDLPDKGNIIKIDGKRYRVLNLDDNVALLLALYDASSAQAFDSVEPYNYQYKDSALDEFLNVTWFGGTDLSDSLKGAIVPTTISQYAYRQNTYTLEEYTTKGYYDDGGTVQKYLITKNDGEMAVGERNVFALDLQDIADYLGKDNLIDSNIQNMFDMTSGVVWLRSADGGDDHTFAWDVGTQKGRVTINAVNNTAKTRPSFYVDLSKVNFEIDDSTVDRFTITTSVNNENMGSATGGDTYNAGMEVVLTAKPKARYRFVKWDDDVTDNPRTVTVTEDAEYKAQFEPLMPEKGNVIKISDKKYRVLSIDDKTAFVVALYDLDCGAFGDSNTYVDSNVDTKLKEWYEGLTTDSELKKGIVKTTGLQQDTYSWYLGSPANENYVAKGSYLDIGVTTSYYVTNRQNTKSIGERFVFALDVQDIVDYLGKDNLTYNNIYSMFDVDGDDTFWLRSAGNTSSSYVWRVSEAGYMRGFHIGTPIPVRLAFNIDLSKAVFEIDDSTVDRFTITTSVNDENRGSVTEGGTYNEGMEVVLTAKAKDGYVFDKWVVDGADGPADSEITITVESDATYIAQFVEEAELVLEADGNGSITFIPGFDIEGYTGGAVQMTFFVGKGNEITITASPKEGYKLKKWVKNDTEDLASRELSLTVTITEDVKYTAVFEEEILPHKGDVIKIGEDQYRVLTIDNKKALVVALFNAKESQPYWDTTAQTTTFGTGIPEVLGAKYDGSALDTYLNTTWYGEQSTELKGAIVKATNLTQGMYERNNGTPSGNSYIAKGKNKYSSDYRISKGENYNPVSINDKFVFALDVQNVANYFNGDDLSSEKLKAIFEIDNDIFWLRSAITPGETNAFVITGEDGEFFHKGATSSYAARPAFYVDLSKTIFNIDETYQKYNITVKSNDEEKGSTTGSGSYYKGATADIIATPNTGYKFVQWSDGNTDNPRTVVVTEDKMYTATFEEKVLPSQGDVIKIDGNRYRVLSVHDYYLVTALYSANSSIEFDTTYSNVYEGSNLDNYFENEWYANLPEESSLKKGIVETSGLVQNTINSAYEVTNYVDISPRHVYALDAQEILNYIGGSENVNSTVLREMFDTTSAHIWTRSASNSPANAIAVRVEFGYITNFSVAGNYNAYPAFNIDLNKSGVDYEIETPGS